MASATLELFEDLATELASDGLARVGRGWLRRLRGLAGGVDC